MTDDLKELRERLRESAVCSICDGNGRTGTGKLGLFDPCLSCGGSGRRAFDIEALDAVLDNLLARIEALEARS